MAQKPRVLVSLLSEKQEFQKLQAETARATGERLGIDVEVAWAESNPVTQLHQLYDALRAPEGSRPAALVIEPAAVAGLEAAARAAVAAGVGWVLLGDRADVLERLQQESPGKLVCTLGTDNEGIGRLQARIYRALLPRGGRMVHVEGPSFSAAAIHRRKLMQEGLAGSGIEIVKVLTGDWSTASAERAATFWLRLGAKAAAPDLVAAQNDQMAEGVRQAVTALRPDWTGVAYVGVDGLPDGGQRLVREKVLAATIVTPPPTGPAVELVARALRGEQVPPFSLMAPRALPAVEELRPVKA